MDMNPIASGNRDNIGEIDLALHIVRANPFKRLKQKMGINAINTGVNFPDLFLCRAGIFFFNNLDNVSVFIGNNSSIVVWFRHIGRHHRYKGSAFDMSIAPRSCASGIA